MLKKINLFLVVFISLWILYLNEVQAMMIDKMQIACDNQVSKRILEDDIIHQTFVSETDEFGIVAIKFTNYLDISDDSLIFRIKEKDTEEWHFEYAYQVDQMQNDEYFTFGIPPITKALNKQYVFELESLSGKQDDSIGVYLCEDTGDVVFKLVQGVPALNQLKNDIQFRISSDLGFFILWSLIIGALLLKTTKYESKEK